MKLTEKTVHMLAGGVLVLAGFAAAHVVIAVGAPTGDTPAIHDAITVRHLRVVDEQGDTRVHLHVTPVDDPGGPIDVMQVRNATGAVVHRLAIYEEGRGGGILSVRDRSGQAIGEMGGGIVTVRSGSGDGRAEATLRASRDGAKVAAVGPDAEVYVGAAPGGRRAASLRADHNGGVLALANRYDIPKVVLRVGDDDIGVVQTLGEHTR